MFITRSFSANVLLLIAILSFGFAKFSFAQSPSLPQKVVLTTHDLYPYGSYQSNGSFSGVAHDVVVCSLDKIGVALDLRVLPWRRAQLEVFEGQADGFYAGSQNSVRDEKAVRSAEIAGQIWQWYLNKDSSWDTNSIEFRKNASVSSFLGANMQKWLVENNYKVNASPIDTQKLLELLFLGRIDAALANNYVMDDILRKRGVEDRVRREVLKNKPLYVYFKKSFIELYPDFLDAFNQGVGECKR